MSQENVELHRHNVDVWHARDFEARQSQALDELSGGRRRLSRARWAADVPPRPGASEDQLEPISP